MQMGNRGTMDAKKAEEDEMKTIKELQDHRVVDGAPVAALGVIEIPSAGRYTRRIVRAVPLGEQMRYPRVTLRESAPTTGRSTGPRRALLRFARRIATSLLEAGWALTAEDYRWVS